MSKNWQFNFQSAKCYLMQSVHRKKLKNRKIKRNFFKVRKDLHWTGVTVRKVLSNGSNISFTTDSPTFQRDGKVLIDSFDLRLICAFEKENIWQSEMPINSFFSHVYILYIRKFEFSDIFGRKHDRKMKLSVVDFVRCSQMYRLKISEIS